MSSSAIATLPAEEKQYEETTDVSGQTTRAPSTSRGDAEKAVVKEDGPSAAPAVDDEAAAAERPAAAAQHDGEYPGGLQLTFIVVALVLGIFLISLDMTIVATAIPRITDDFHSINDISWYGSAFFLTLGGFQSTWGKAYKYFPLKTSFLLAIFVFELGSLICGVAPNSPTLIVGRAIAGLGAAGTGSGAYTIIGFSVAPQKRATFTGIVGASYGLAAVIGPLIGGAFTDRITWRWCFYINLPIGGVAGLIILLFFHTPTAAQPLAAPLREKLLQMDLPGTTLLMGAVISFILALQYGGQTHPWASSLPVGLLVGFVLLLAAFTAVEVVQGERAMLAPRLMRDRNVWVSGVFACVFAGAYFVVIYYLPLYFQSIDGASPIASGVRNLPLILAVTVATVVSGASISRTGVATPLMVVGAVLATVAAGLLYTLDVGTGSGPWIGYQVLGGLGWGVAFQVPMIIGQGTAAPSDLASVTAIILFFQTIGGAFLVGAAQSGFVNQLLHELPALAPGVDPILVVATGATQLRAAFPADQLDGVLRAYMAGLKVAFAIATGAVGVSVPVSLLSKWKRIHADGGVGGAV